MPAKSPRSPKRIQKSALSELWDDSSCWEFGFTIAGLHYSGFWPVSEDRYERNQLFSQRTWSENSVRRRRIREVGLKAVASSYCEKPDRSACKPTAANFISFVPVPFSPGRLEEASSPVDLKAEAATNSGGFARSQAALRRGGYTSRRGTLNEQRGRNMIVWDVTYDGSMMWGAGLIWLLTWPCWCSASPC